MMKTTLKLAAAIALAAGLSLPASAKDKAASVPASLKGKLIELKDGKIQDATIAADKEFYLLYHSASWWGGCKAVTKQLASINKKNLKLGAKSKFQIVLVGYDRDAKGNKGYLEKGVINFPAIKIAEKEGLENLTKKGETGFIPNLVLLKPDGTMVSNDKEEVLKKLAELAKG